MNKEHAEHNEEVCKLLLSTKKFNDWVITTAFYSSLHFALNKLFPLTTGADSYENIDSYYVKNKLHGKCSKHIAICSLVSSNLPSIRSEYKWLLDVCMTARYHNYKIKEVTANRAVIHLDKIKAHC